MKQHGFHDVSSVRDYLRVVRRRKGTIALCALAVPATAIGVSLFQQHLYQASAQVLLSRQNLAASLTGTQDPSAYQQPERIAQTQAELARVPAVADRALAALGLGESAERLLRASEVEARNNSDLLEFRVTDSSPALAVRLATEYAHQFTLFRRELDTAALGQARSEVKKQIEKLESSGSTDSPLFASLVDKEQQLATMEALQTSNALVVRPADDTVKVQPRPVRNGILGLVLGLVLGLGLGFLRETLDTRVRSAEEISDRLRLPLLGRLPEPPHRLRGNDRLVMLAEPSGDQAEAFRMLRTNLEFVNLERNCRTIMVTSSGESEGKSTTVANLAVAIARAGRHVVLVDLDLRRPSIDRFFDLRGRPGLTDVALGRVELERALVTLTIGAPLNGNGAHGNGHGDVRGALKVLPAGPQPPDTGEFVATHVLTNLLSRLEESADIVLIDAPPLLQVGDALTLSAKVDALIVVARLGSLRRGTLSELARILYGSPAEKLGFVVTDARVEEGYDYRGYYYEATPPVHHREPVA